MRPFAPRKVLAVAPLLLAAQLLVACGGEQVEGGAAELEFAGGALDGSEDAAIALEESLEKSLEGDAPPVLSTEPIEDVIERMGLTNDEARAMIQLPDDVIRQLAAARAAEEAEDLVDTSPPERLADGSYVIRFRHLSLDALDDFEFEALMDSVVGRAAEDAEPIDFPAEIKALDGKVVSLTGYMIPVDWQRTNVLKFMLVRDLLACCFGGAPQPDEWVDAELVQGAKAKYYPFVPVVAKGRFSIQGMPDEQGYAAGCYRLDVTKVEKQ